MNKLLLLSITLLAITGCTSNPYNVVTGNYSWSKGENSYSSETMYKINSETGEAWKMTHNQKKGYIWEPITHLDTHPID